MHNEYNCFKFYALSFLGDISSKKTLEVQKFLQFDFLKLF